MKLKPLQDWAVIKITDSREKSAGGIIIPDSAREKPSEGIIISIGPGKYKTEKKDKKKEKKTFIPTVMRPGQRVVFMDYMTREVEVGGETITVVREEDILGYFEETSPAVKRSFEIEEKKDRPVAVKTKAEIVPAAAPRPAGTEKETAPPLAKKKAAQTAVRKKREKPKKAAAKKTSKAKPAKKTAAKRSAQKTTFQPKKKNVSSKKAKPAQKKPSAKKTAPKKAGPKRSASKPAVKKGRSGTKKRSRT